MAPLELHHLINFEPASNAETEKSEIIQSVIEMLNAPIPEELVTDADSHVESPKIAEIRTKIQMAQSEKKKGPRSNMETRKYVNRLSAKLSREIRKEVMQSLKLERALLENEQALLKRKLKQIKIQNNILRSEVTQWQLLTDSVPHQIHVSLGLLEKDLNT